MKAGWKITAANHDHEETKQMMSGFGYRLSNCADIRRRRCRNRLGMSVPVADKVQTVSMHFVDLPLFLASVGKVQISRPAI